MKLTALILIIAPFLCVAQQKYDTIYVEGQIFLPSVVGKFICDTAYCEGSCQSFYENGFVHLKGYFENGTPVKDLYEYHENGKLAEQYTFLTDGYMKKEYYESGQLKSDIQHSNTGRNEEEYFSNGVLRKRYAGSMKSQKLREFNNSGIEILKQNDRVQCRYFQNGIIKSRIERRKRSYLTETSYGRKIKSEYFDFIWFRYDTTGTVTTKIEFTNYGKFRGGAYPYYLTDIELISLDKVTHYNNGKPQKQVSVDYKFKGDEITYKAETSTKKNGIWIEEEEAEIKDIDDILEIF
jgi:antitoxin component YwqK of YwqJK toxin-antitoxin module